MLKHIATISRTGFAILAALTIASCASEGGSGSESETGPDILYPTVSLLLSTLVEELEESGGLAPQIAGGTVADIAQILVTVTGEDRFGVHQDPLGTAELLNDGSGSWTGELAELPAGPPLTFAVGAVTATGLEIFSGSLTRTLTPEDSLLTLSLFPVDNGVPLSIPRILAITRPLEILVSTLLLESLTAIPVDVQGSPNEVLSYAFDSPLGLFSPTTGTIPLPSSGIGTLASNFLAPLSIGTLWHSIRVTNSQGNSVETDFDTSIVFSLLGLEVQTLLAPVVSALATKRTGADVEWTVDVVDDTLDGISYQWTFIPDEGSNAPAFENGNLATAVLAGYDETVSGLIELTITDASGLVTTVEYILEAGQFPDDPIVSR